MAATATATAPPTAGRPTVPSACYAPHSALYLRPDGVVTACCASVYQVGTVAGPMRRSLRQIWEGARLAAQRTALEAGDFGLGCYECAYLGDAAGRAGTLAQHFDRWAAEEPYDGPRMLDLALSNTCNLQCVMCNGELSSAIRNRREHRRPMASAYDDRFFEELEEFLPHIERFQFKGGEPFLGLENRRIWDRLLELGTAPEVTVTTNGTQFDERIERYVRDLRMHVIVSVDGMDPAVLEAIRVGVEADVLWANVERFQAITAQTGAGMTLSACIVRDNWREALAVLLEADRREVNGNLIVVNAPAEHSILEAPLSDRAAALAAMEAAAPTFRSATLAQEWEVTVATVRRATTEPTLSIVTHRSRHDQNLPLGRRRLRPDEVVALEARLAQAGPLVVLDAVDDRIVSLDDAPWAAPLRTDRWMGRGLADLEALVAETGRTVAIEQIVEDPEAEGVLRFALRVRDADGELAFEVVTTDLAEPGRSRIYLVPAS